MDILYRTADSIHTSCYQVVRRIDQEFRNKDLKGQGNQVVCEQFATNLKTALFNGFTIGLITTIAMTFLGLTSITFGLITGSIHLFGRMAASEAYSKPLPTWFPKLIKNLLKPKPLFTIKNIVILYQYKDLEKPTFWDKILSFRGRFVH